MLDISAAEQAGYMARALQLAAQARLGTRPNPCVGCVLVRDGVIVGEAWHERAGRPHAERRALAQAGAAAAGATCYVTLEPCAHHGRTDPCADALVAAGVRAVVAAVADPNPRVAGGGLERLRAAGVAVQEGLMGAAAERLNAGFFQRMRTGRPRVRAKVAASLDGRTAMASGESRWITSAAARTDVQALRAASGAILTGIGTVLADDPRLTVRGPLATAIPAQPLRVVLDTELRTPPDARLFQEPGETLVYTAADPKLQAAERVELCRLDAAGRQPDLGAVLADLGRREINDVLVEAGPRLTGALLEADLVDELVIYMAPLLLGAEGRPLAELPGIAALADAHRLRIEACRRVGEDLRLTLAPSRQA